MIRHTIEEALEALISDLGYELWGCEYFPRGRGSLLRIYIDKKEGIGILDCEKVSKQVSAYLDVEDPFSESYRLEISSPGIPRQLLRKEHYSRYIGHAVEIKLYKPIKGRRKLTGIIMAANQDFLLLNIDDDQLEIDFSDIVKANLIGE